MHRATRWPVAGLSLILVLAGVVGLGLSGCVTSEWCCSLCPPDCAAMSKGGAQLWAENCARCHNSRPPTTYSDAEWDVAMHHMRVRANLTALEHQKIVEFLKAAN